MYSSNSQDYAYIPDAYLHPQTSRRNEVPPSSYSSQTNYGHGQFMGSTHSNGGGHLQMPHSSGSYGNMPMALPMIQDTAESLQRDFDQYMRDTAGSRAPFPSDTHHSAQVVPPYRQHPYATVHPSKLYGGGHAHSGDSRGGQQAVLPVNSRGTDSSTSTRSYHSSVSKPYSKDGPAAQPTGSQTARNGQIVNKDARVPAAQLPQVMGPGPLAPTGYVVVPQAVFYCGPTTYPPIEFMPWKWNTLGNKAIHRLTARHRIEQAHDIVLSHLREIIIKIQWPGYPQFPFETRIKIKEGKITRGELVELVCDAVVDFVQKLKENRYLVKKGLEEWMIGSTGLKVYHFFVPRLIHRGGNYFQPEIWVPE